MRSAHKPWAFRRACLVLGLLVLLAGASGHARPQPGPAAAAAAPAPAAPAAPAAPPAPIVRRVFLTGTVRQADGAQRLLSFLHIDPGAPWDAQLQSRVLSDLKALGYDADANIDERGDLTLVVHVIRVVRRIFISGNWPLFETKILSNLTWRPGYRLPDNEFLVAEIRKQEGDVTSYLQRDGYYDATTRITLEWQKERPEQVDVRVQVDLNIGFWRLRYGLGLVRTQGFHLLKPEEVRSYFDHCCLWIGRTSTNRINEDVKRLIDHYQKHNYPGARLIQRDIKPNQKRKQVDIDLTIEERKRIELIFTGRKALSEKELRAEVTIFRNNYYSANEMEESAHKLFQLYQRNGYFEARVGWRWKSRDTDPLQVEFVIHEGPELKVRDVSFTSSPPGRPLAIAEPKLQEQVQTKRYPRLGVLGLGEGGYATAIQLEQDVRRLEEFYHGEGYPHARVTVEVARTSEALAHPGLVGLHAALEDDEGGDLHVRFQIDEGAHEFVERVEIEFEGPHVLSPTDVRKALRLTEGTSFTGPAKEADAARLGHLYRQKGHPYVALQGEPIANGPRVTMRWLIKEGPEVRFGTILIRGNFVTKERVIRKNLPFKEGDLFDENKLLEAKQNLEQMQLFSFVRVTENPGETPQYAQEVHEAGWSAERNPLPVLVEIGERNDNYGEIALYVGASSYNPIYSLASYNWRDILGTGLDAELRGELGIRIQSFFVRLADPQLLGLFWRLDLRGFWRNELTDSLGLVNSYGGNAELTRFVARTDAQGRRLPPSLKFFTKLEFNISQILVPLPRTEGPNDRTTSQTGDQTQAFKLSVGLVWDRRVGLDAPLLRKLEQLVPINPLMPASGFLLSAQATVAACCSIGSINSIPTNFTNSFVALAGMALGLLPFGPELKPEDGWPYGMRRFKLIANLRVNYGIPLFPKDHATLPAVERFFAGGDSTTRGYDNDSLRAEELRVPVAPLGDALAYRVKPEGGNIRLLSSLELEFAITPIKTFGWPWVGALFVDTGAVFDNWTALTWNDIRFSVGVSILRLLTTFGALSVEYAYPITLPGQEPALQSDRWKQEPWYFHWPGRIHFNWGIPISL